MTGESATIRNKSLRTHIIKSGLLGDDQSDLSDSGSIKQASRVAEGVLRRMIVNTNEQRKNLYVVILAQGTAGHVNVTLPNSLTLDTTEENGLLLGDVLKMMSIMEKP